MFFFCIYLILFNKFIILLKKIEKSWEFKVNVRKRKMFPLGQPIYHRRTRSWSTWQWKTGMHTSPVVHGHPFSWWGGWRATPNRIPLLSLVSLSSFSMESIHVGVGRFVVAQTADVEALHDDCHGGEYSRWSYSKKKNINSIEMQCYKKLTNIFYIMIYIKHFRLIYNIFNKICHKYIFTQFFTFLFVKFI